MRKLIFLLSVMTATVTYAANWPERPSLRAVRVTVAPAIDGDLSDAAWQGAPEFTDFTQHDPNDGQPATMRTSIRIVYDDDAIYFGAKMEDPHAPTTLLARRDSFTTSDFLSINLDPQHDRLSGNAFTINPSNVQVDTVLYNDIGEDSSWDGVWDSATRIVPDGWIAEVRIPFSQLRFPERAQHVWGVNITRRTVRNNEWARIVNTKKGETGFVSHFADITGLDGIQRGRPFELVPYAVARSDFRTRVDSRDPLTDRRGFRGDGGLDLKYALTSSLTLTGTINPDFGQVEVDPAVVNLSDFETFYPERRPFFTEGLNIFRFGDSPAPSHFNFFSAPQMFYSRRIGRSPQALPDADFVVAPSETTILGAAKVTGRLAGGWSIGVLDALTDTERARFADLDETPDDDVEMPVERRHVEPMTNYFVARGAKELAAGSRVGFMVTSVNRRLAEELSQLRESAISAGVDGYTSFRERSWILEGNLVGSSVRGSSEAIEATQRSSSRYYQRPDAGHVTLDPTRTSLTGWGGTAMVSKATGLWRPIVQVRAYSPGFETNDAGFLQRTDIISTHALMQYVDQRTTPRFREKNVWFGAWQNRNFDGDTLERGFFVDHFATWQNYWNYRTAAYVMPGAFDDRLTRGGPVVRSPSRAEFEGSIGSDERKKFFFEVNTELDRADDDSYYRALGVALTARPAANLTLSVEPRFSRSRNTAQYVTPVADATATETYGTRHVVADLHQSSFELGTRADWTLSSRLSLQLYLQPFIASGDYRDFRALVAPRTRDYASYAGTVSNRDFNFRSVRGSAVARWEFRPGSALYVVWSENRQETERIGDFRLGRDLRAIPTAPSHDVFLVKVSYWLPM
ncbi:MAG TPA: DUF5916 domain-containing protein [Thermoanaerobaculia bacterium]